MSHLLSYLALVAVASLLLGVMLAVYRKVSAKTAEPTRRRLILSTPLAPQAAFQKLERTLWIGHCKLADVDAERRVLVLSSGITGWSWGFFYPVFVRASASGSEIEVGARARVPQFGPIVANNHKACVAEIEKALAA
jgi:hypothetical protein